MNIYKKWQNNESSERSRFVALIVGALIFPVSIPAILVFLLPPVDKMIGAGSFYAGYGNVVVGVIAIILGGFLAFWTIGAQIILASGTPFPMLPTKKLLVVGPFKYCRNLMTLGTVTAYFGIAVIIGSYAAVLFVVLFTLMLAAYLKLVEEKELALRFGKDYLDYRDDTPFILPFRFAAVKKKQT